MTGINNRQVGYLDTVIAYYEKVVLLKDSSELIFHPDSSIEAVDTANILTVFTRPVKKLRGLLTLRQIINEVYNINTKLAALISLLIFTTKMVDHNFIFTVRIRISLKQLNRY